MRKNISKVTIEIMLKFIGYSHVPAGCVQSMNGDEDNSNFGGQVQAKMKLMKRIALLFIRPSTVTMMKPLLPSLPCIM